MIAPKSRTARGREPAAGAAGQPAAGPGSRAEVKLLRSAGRASRPSARSAALGVITYGSVRPWPGASAWRGGPRLPGPKRRLPEETLQGVCLPAALRRAESGLPGAQLLPPQALRAILPKTREMPLTLWGRCL